MSPEERAQRLIALYLLRTKVHHEIAALEAAIDNEGRALKRAKQAAARLQLPVPRKLEALCGTDGGYYRHRRTLKEPPCDACKLAHSIAEKVRARDRKNRAEPLVLSGKLALAPIESETRRGPESLAGNRPSDRHASLDYTEERSG